MCNQSEWIVREAFLALTRGDVTRMMDFVHPDLEWTDRGPVGEDPGAQPRRGRSELEEALRQRAASEPRAEIEQVIAAADKVMLVMRMPGLDHQRKPDGDRTYDVVTVRDGLIVGLHSCRDLAAARSLVGLG